MSSVILGGSTLLGMALMFAFGNVVGDAPVSYTHLDVYKRQIYYTFPWLYWIETAAWIFITFCLFKKFPSFQSNASHAPASD